MQIKDDEMTTYTNVKETELEKLNEFGFWKEKGKTQYEVLRFRNKNNVVMILFTTDKLLVQGKENYVREVEKILQDLKIGKKVIPLKFVNEKGVVIGSDESMKGDSFGGLIVAAVKADDKQRQDLMFAGVMDSKKLKDFEIAVIAERIKKIVKYKVLSLMPEEYNKYDGITQLLNEMHSSAIKELGSADLVVVDKYPGCNVKGRLETKAEQKYVEVAAASILARDEAVKQFDKISKIVGFDVPKGSSQVSDALAEVKKKGIDFRKVTKVRFKNVEKYL